MIGILVELIISWLLLWLFDKTNLLSLGIRPTKVRIYNFLLGFFVASFFCIIYYFVTASLADNNFILNKEFTVKQFFKSSSWTLNSVLFEELIFRGALLYIAIKKLGIRTACIISAIAFGIYHWFSFGAFGNPIQMIIIFFMTGIWGLMFAFAFAKTKSLYLPIGLHFGWNLIKIVFFSEGPLGRQLLFSSNENKLEGLLSLFFFILQIILLPILTYLFLKSKKSNIESVQETTNR
jgi:membrane protease YdiL (CAAX protease family)